MSAVQDILNQLPLDQLASELGTDQSTAQQTAEQAISTLMGQLEVNAGDPEGEQSLAGALRQHSTSTIAQRLVTGDQINLDQVDVEDGEKIVGHVLGDDSARYAASGTDAQMLQKALKFLAPIVLAYVASKISKQGAEGGMGDVLGQILGEALGTQQQAPAPQQQAPSAGGGVLGQILGQILGGGR